MLLRDRGLDHGRLEDLEDPVRQRLDHPVARGRRKRAVDLHVRARVRLDVLGLCRGLSLHHLAEPVDDPLVRLIGRQSGKWNLEEDSGLQQLVERDRAGLERHRDRVAEATADPLLGRPGHEDAAARTLRGTYEVAARKQLESLPERGAADAELAGQILLATEEVAWTEALLLDVVLDLDRHLFARAANGARLRASGGLPAPRLDAHENLRGRESTTRRDFPFGRGSTPRATGTTRTRRPSCWRMVSCRRRAAPPSSSSTSSLISSMPLGSV